MGGVSYGRSVIVEECHRGGKLQGRMLHGRLIGEECHSRAFM